MGLSSSSKKQTTKPVYEPQITGAARDITNAYNAQAPKVTKITDQLGSLVPGLLDTYQNGDPNVNLAKDYNADVLGGKYLNSNPYLQSVIDATNSDVRNGVTASLGTRGLVGGSAQSDIVSRNLANNENQLRYTDYNNERTRMDNATIQAAQLAAAGYLPLSIIQSIADAQQMPIRAAAGAGAGVGGLLGQYTNKKVKDSPSTMDGIGQALDIGSTIAGFF